MKITTRLTVAVLVCGCASSPRATTPAPSSTAPRVATNSPLADSSRDVMMRVTGSDVFSPQRGDAALKAFAPEVSTDLKEGECNLTRTGGSGALIVFAYFPARTTSQTQMTLSFDSAGHLVRFNERRGIPKLPPMANVTPARRDSILRFAEGSVRSTNISLDYAVDQAVVMNRGGGRPTNAIIGTVRAIEALEQLGPPRAHVERARRLCGV